MKTLPLLALLPLCAAAAPMTERITSAELQSRRQISSPVIELNQLQESEAKVVRSGEQSLIRQSVIISDGANWTLVPKGAVLHLPASHTSKVGVKPLGNLMPWKDFLVANRAWLSAEEISMRQAEGVQALDDRRTAYWPKQDKVIIAVHLGGPISVATPEPANETASAH